jgi:hypothetical protein
LQFADTAGYKDAAGDRLKHHESRAGRCVWLETTLPVRGGCARASDQSAPHGGSLCNLAAAAERDAAASWRLWRSYRRITSIRPSRTGRARRAVPCAPSTRLTACVQRRRGTVTSPRRGGFPADLYLRCAGWMPPVPPTLCTRAGFLAIILIRGRANYQQYFSLGTNQPAAISQQYFSLRIN